MMSSPSETQSVKSITVSSPQATDATYEDTASSVLAEGAPPGLMVQWWTNTPNTAFNQQMKDARLRSVSPWPRRAISPSKLSVAQQRAQIAEQKAESAFSGAGSLRIRPVMRSPLRKPQ